MLTSCESYLMEHREELTEVEELIYKPTFVAIKFLYHNDTYQVSGVDTIYLDNAETVVWDISDYPGAQFDIVHFQLVKQE